MRGSDRVTIDVSPMSCFLVGILLGLVFLISSSLHRIEKALSRAYPEKEVGK